MCQFEPLIGERLLGDHHAESVADSERHSAGRISLHLVRLVALVWTLIQGQSCFAGSNLTREKVPPRHGPVRTTKVIRFVTHYRVGFAEPDSDSIASSIEDPSGSSVNDRQNDQSDDGTSDDPNDDDDAWDDLKAAVDTETPVIVWLPQTLLFLSAPEPESASLWFEFPTSPSRALQRLRC
jgi:hypothetical protein